VGVAIGGGDDLVGHALVGLGEFGELAADEALGGENGVFRVGDGLAFGGLADEALAVFGESDHRGGGAGTFRVFQHDGLAAFHDGHAGVGGAEVDSENFGHKVVSFQFAGGRCFRGVFRKGCAKRRRAKTQDATNEGNGSFRGDSASRSSRIRDKCRALAGQGVTRAEMRAFRFRS
jgi:hypothetical protein